MGWLNNQLAKDLERVPRNADEAARGFKRQSMLALLMFVLAGMQITMSLILDLAATAAISGIIFAYGVMMMAQAYDLRHWYHRLSIA